MTKSERDLRRADEPGVDEASREGEERLERELVISRELQAISRLLIEGGDSEGLHQKIVEAASSIMRSDAASLQLLDYDVLRLVAFSGMPPELVRSLDAESPDAVSPSMIARRSGRRIVVHDVETSELFAGTQVLRAMRQLGMRGLQATPVVSRRAGLLGVLATLWREPHTPDENDLQALDSLARHAADLIERKRADDAMARLAAIVSSSDDAIISKDLDGIIRSWNKGAERMFGYSSEETIGKPVTILIPEDHIDEEPEILQRIRRGESVQHYETIRRRKDGSLLDIGLTVSPVRDASGRIVGASKIARDITRRKRAEAAIRESEARLRFMAESMPQKIFTARADGRHDYLNTEWLEYTGLSFEEWSWERFVHPEDVERTLTAWRRSVVSGEPLETEHRCRRVNGEYRWHLSRARSLRDPAGEVAIWVGSSTDVQEVKEADRRKDEFLATLAHELRNPLAPVVHAARLLAEPSLDPRAMRRAIEIVSRQTTRMSRLLDDLLDVSRITRGMVELRRQRVDLREVIDAAIETHQDRLVEAQHELLRPELSTPIWLDADSLRLEQVLGNLLSNAIKYTPSRGSIELTVDLEPGWVTVRVRDTGVGISAEALPHIFDLFLQEKREGRTDGLGIGLTVVRSLVKLHGGQVSAFSAGPGQGAELSVRLPRLGLLEAPGSKRASSGADANAASGPSRRVLIVEDNADAADVLSALLQSWGHTVHTVDNGPEALERVDELRPDLILLDVGLPDMSGYEVAAKLRRQPALAGTPIVAVTGYGQERDRELSREAGFDEHLVKPVSPDELQGLLARLACN